MSTLHLKKDKYGIILEYGKCKISLDTGKRGTYTLLSHSHMDHVGDISKSNQIIATRATFDSYLARGGRLRNNTIEINYGESISKTNYGL